MAQPLIVRPPPKPQEKEVLIVKPPHRPVVQEKEEVIERPMQRPQIKEKIVAEQKPRVQERVVVKEQEKLKQRLNYSPEQSISGVRTFAPSYSYDNAYAPEEFTAQTQVYSPSLSTRQRYAPKQVTATRQVYAPKQKVKQRYAPYVKQSYVYKPSLVDKLVAIFAPQTITKQREDIKYKPYDYQETQTAIIDTYDPEQFTEVQKFAPKTDESFSLRIAPEAELSVKVNPTPAFITSVNYGILLKRLLR